MADAEGVSAVTFDLYAWAAPRDLDDERAVTLIQDWQADGGEPSASPFEPSTDVGWFHRELTEDLPNLETSSDAVARLKSVPIWMSGTDEAPARIVAIRLAPGTPRDALETIFSLAAKYDLVVFDARNRRLHLPLQQMAAHASATFWPAGAIQAGVAGAVGAAIAIGAWIFAIPVLSGIAVIVGGFLFLMAVVTFVHEGRKALRAGPGRESDS